jgi:hypothetical protein
MHLQMVSRRTWLLCGALGASFLTACTTPPPLAHRMEPSAEGTVTVFHRQSTGSLGDYDGTVVWQLHDARWNGKKVDALISPQMGGQILEPESDGLIATLDRSGDLLLSFDPPMAFEWPLQVGKRWQSQHTMTFHNTGRSIPLFMDWAVESYGDVTVPAGTFKAYKVILSDGLGDVETRWVAPQQGIGTLKRSVLRMPGHPLGPGQLDAEMLSRTPPSH